MRWIGEQPVREDFGFIPSFADWAKAIRPEPWMGRSVIHRSCASALPSDLEAASAPIALTLTVARVIADAEPVGG